MNRNHIDVRDFVSKLIGEDDLTHEAGISEDRCGQWSRKGKRRRRIEVEVGWLEKDRFTGGV